MKMKIYECEQQAKRFLAACGATMKIKYAGLDMPRWENKLHCAYDCEIKTPRGKMTVRFYDSLRNTKIRADSKLPMSKRREAEPTEYDVLACLQKYDVGNMEDFMSEFGYEIKSVKDMTDFIGTYNAVVKEYNSVCAVFTPEQMELLREIQ